jgi:hypothetical protein
MRQLRLIRAIVAAITLASFGPTQASDPMHQDARQTLSMLAASFKCPPLHGRQWTIEHDEPGDAPPLRPLSERLKSRAFEVTTTRRTQSLSSVVPAIDHPLRASPTSDALNSGAQNPLR